MKINLTGHRGFIGSHFHKFLLNKKYDVQGYDKSENFDLMDQSLMSKIRDCDVLIHLAAFNGTKYFYSKPKEVLLNNTLPTINLVNRYENSKTKFVFASTCEIFNGAIDKGIYNIPTDENVPIMFEDIINPRWSYSIPKALGENLISNSGLEWLILRYFNVYGPYQKDHFISEFATRVINGDYYIIGNDTRSFCFIDDAVEISYELIKSASNEIINVGNQSESKISDVAKIILDILGVDPTKLEILPSPKGSVSRRCPDTSKMKSKIKFNKYTDLRKGLEITLKEIL